MDRDGLKHSVVLPPDAPARVRRALGLRPGSELKIAFFSGPGDVVGTFDYWTAGQHEPRTPIIAYSEMFFTLAAQLEAEAFILSESGQQPEKPVDGFHFVHTPRPRGRRGIGYRLDEFSFYRHASKRIREIDPHVVVAGGDAPNALIRAIPETARTILTVHNCFWQMGQPPKGPRARFRLFRKSRAFRRLHGAVCVSQACADQLETLGVSPEICKVQIPQILQKFAGSGDPNPMGPARRLVFLGRIEVEKGVFDLLAAFQKLAAEFPDLSLDFAGTGQSMDDLEQAVRESQLNDRITLHGRLGSEDVHSLLQGSDLLICPTRDDSGFFEGLAVVVAEAGIHGVPSVVSTVVPAQELFPGGSAVFPAGDADALEETLRSIIDNPQQYSGMQSTTLSSIDRFFDRSLSWGSTLYASLEDQAGRGAS